MSSIEDIWADLKSQECASKNEYKKKLSTLSAKTGQQVTITDLITSSEKKSGKADKKTKKLLLNKPSKILSCEVEALKSSVLEPALPCAAVMSTEQEHQSCNQMLVKIAKDLNLCSSDDIRQRRQGLTNMYQALFVNSIMSPEDFGEVFGDICKTLFRMFADGVEICREWSFKIVGKFFEHSSDVVGVLGYYFPALMQRLATDMGYDEELKVFVVDMDAHAAYRRGKAVDRQDKSDLLKHSVIEISEEVRLLACKSLGALIKRTTELGSSAILHPYFHEIILFLQMQLRDPLPDLKQEACEILELMAINVEYETGMKFFAVGLARAVLPVLQHRHAKVRQAAVTCLKACIAVPDKAKCKGAGTDAIFDLVGFREDNVLQVASFYKVDVQVNYLAELVCDNSTQVREKLVEMLRVLLTEIGDRYDYQTRLLPYLLDLLTDDAPSVSGAALSCLVTCGRQYELEHHDEIIDRRQYGVDGDDRINLDRPLPLPFVERPRLGIRLYVRGNTKRFLFALVNELTNWLSHTRLKSTHLLKMIVVLCEEHLTMEAHTLLPSFIKALEFAREDKDKQLHALLLEVYELVGRYMAPDVYIHYILPRLRGDTEIVQFGVDANTRTTVLEFLRVMLDGSKASQVAPFFDEITATLVDSYVISTDSKMLQSAALETLLTLLHAMEGQGKAAMAGHFLATGRLSSLQAAIQRCFKYLLGHTTDGGSEFRVGAIKGLQMLAHLHDSASLEALFSTHMVILFKDMINDGNYEVDAMWSKQALDHRLLKELIFCPLNLVQADCKRLSCSIAFILANITQAAETTVTSNDDEFVCEMCALLVHLVDSIMLPTVGSSTAPYLSLKHFVTDPSSEVAALGLLGTHEEAAVAAARECLQSHVVSMIDILVLNKLWCRSAVLAGFRVELIRALMGNNSKCDSENIDEIATNTSLVNVDHALQLLDVVMTASLQTFHTAGSPASLRLAVVHTTSQLVQMLKASIGCSRIRSYEYQRSHQDSVDTCRLQLASTLTARLMTPLIFMMDDTQASVRLAAIDTIQLMIPFIVEDSVPDLNSNSNATFSTITTVLLRKYRIFIEHGEEEAVCLALDCVLRGLAVLVPAVFEGLVRAQWQDDQQLPSAVAAALSSLIDHSSLLVQLTTKSS